MTIWEFRALVRQEWQRFERGYCPLGAACADRLSPSDFPAAPWAPAAADLLELSFSYARGVARGFDRMGTGLGLEQTELRMRGYRYGRRMRFIASKKGYLSP